MFRTAPVRLHYGWSLLSCWQKALLSSAGKDEIEDGEVVRLAVLSDLKPVIGNAMQFLAVQPACARNIFITAGKNVKSPAGIWIATALFF
jgi:hypothetical protein